MSREAYYRYFSVLISHVKVVPVASRSNTIITINDNAHINFDFALYKQLSTQPSIGDRRRMCWYDHRPFEPFEYKTIYEPEELKLKVVRIHLFREKRDDEEEPWTSHCWSFLSRKSRMELVGETVLNMHTIASGPTHYSLPIFLEKSKGKSIIANISFDLQMTQYSTNLTFHLQNFHIERSIWLKMHQILLNQQAATTTTTTIPPMKIDFAWIDPRPKQRTVLYEFHKQINWDRILDQEPSTVRVLPPKKKRTSVVKFSKSDKEKSRKHSKEEDDDDDDDNDEGEGKEEEDEEVDDDEDDDDDIDLPNNHNVRTEGSAMDRHRTRATTVKNIMLCINDREVSAFDLMCGSLNARIWCEHNGKALEMGRMVLPVAQFYKPDLESTPLGLTERIMWNEHSFRTFLQINNPQQPSPSSLRAFVYDDPAFVQFNLNVQFGSDFMQLYEGQMHGNVITGEYFMGFPVPDAPIKKETTFRRASKSVGRIRHHLELPEGAVTLRTVIISSWIASRVLTDHFLVALETYHYEIPDWFVRRQPLMDLLQTVSAREQTRQLEERENYEFKPRPSIHHQASAPPQNPKMITSIHTNDAENTIITIATDKPVLFTSRDEGTMNHDDDNDDDNNNHNLQPGLEMAAMYSPSQPRLLSLYETYRAHYKKAKYLYETQPTAENKAAYEQWKLKMKSAK